MIRFLVFSDLHYDHVFDANNRIQLLINKINEIKPNFVISLGDLCYPTSSNRHIINEFHNLKIPFYHCLGNHDCEDYSQTDLTGFWNSNDLNYSFSIDDIKFIILNSSFMKHNGKELLYNKGIYNKQADTYPIISQTEIEWLKNEMSNTEIKYVIFSHHSLANEFPKRGINNRNVIRELLEKRHTLLAMNGHDHGNDLTIINQVPYFTVNSSSYIWHGMKSMYPYEADIHSKYPVLKDIILYESPLYCIVEIDDEKINIIGTNTKPFSLKKLASLGACGMVFL